MRSTQLTLLIIGLGLAAACEQERPPRSTTEFLENPIMLEAAMVRCAQDRARTRYDAECVNARQAVRQIEAKEEAKRQAEFEAQSEIKRQTLRRTQQAAAQARRRAAEAERLRKEAEYLAQFGVAPPPDSATSEEAEIGNLPIADIPQAESEDNPSGGGADILPATDGGNAPVITAEPEEEPVSDLGSIRDELQRRNDEGEN